MSLILLPSLFLLGGCGMFVMGVSAAGGLVTFAKDVLDLDVAWHQRTPNKTPIDKALLPMLEIPK